MRKFKVVRKWPGGPEVGTVWEYGYGKYQFNEGELEGFVEEVNWPEEFWWIRPNGTILSSFESPSLSMDVLKEFQFLTKESAEKFAKALKEIKSVTVQRGEAGYVFIQEEEWDGGRAKVKDLIDALNDRVK